MSMRGSASRRRWLAASVLQVAVVLDTAAEAQWARVVFAEARGSFG